MTKMTPPPRTSDRPVRKPRPVDPVVKEYRSHEETHSGFVAASAYDSRRYYLLIDRPASQLQIGDKFIVAGEPAPAKLREVNKGDKFGVKNPDQPVDIYRPRACFRESGGLVATS